VNFEVSTCTKFQIFRGFHLDPAGGAYSTPSDPLAGSPRTPPPFWPFGPKLSPPPCEGKKFRPLKINSDQRHCSAVRVFTVIARILQHVQTGNWPRWTHPRILGLHRISAPARAYLKSGHFSEIRLSPVVAKFLAAFVGCQCSCSWPFS